MKRIACYVTFALVGLTGLLPVQGMADTANGRIGGRVLDRATRKPIPAANVIVIGGQKGAAADQEGSFVVTGLEPGTYAVRASAVGYESVIVSELEVFPNRTHMVDFLLIPRVIEGEEVVVRAGYFPPPSPALPTSSRSFRYEEVRRAPGAAEDVQRMLQALPGVGGGTDQNNEIVVRGGSPFENLIVMDGIEIENINHFGYQGGTGGPISAVNPAFLREVTFASGGFSAKYGDRLSSVLALDLRDGDRERFRGEFEFGMAGAGGNVEGPIDGGRGSYLFSARKSWLEFAPTGSMGLTAIPDYWDSQLKMVYSLSPSHSLTFNGMFGEDEIHFDDEAESGFSRGAEKVDYQGMRYVIGTRLRSIWGNGFSDVIIARSFARFGEEVFEIERDENDNRLEDHIWHNDSYEITDQLHLQYTGRARMSDEWSVGVSLKPITFSHDLWHSGELIRYDDDTIPQSDGSYDSNTDPDTLVYGGYAAGKDTTSLKYAAFAQYTWRPLHTLTLTAGLRYDGFDYSNKHTAGPRLSAQWNFHPLWSLNLAGGVYYQSHPLWVYTRDPNGANSNLAHSQAEQYVAGLKYHPRNSTQISIEGFYKNYSGMLLWEEDIFRQIDGDYIRQSHRFLTDRTKYGWGVELFAHQKLATNWHGTLSYSYGDSRTKDIAWGETPADFDFPNVFAMTFGYQTSFRSVLARFQTKWYGWWTWLLPINGDRFEVSTRLRYMSGRPYTPMIWYEEGTLSPQPVYDAHWEVGDRNSDRYPAYTRWDIRIDNKHYLEKRVLIVFLEVQNLLDRANVSMYSYADDGEIDTIHQFRFFFVGGVRVEF